MDPVSTRNARIANGALAVGGVWLVGLGLYFIALRPALLPEDERFLGASLAVAKASLPGLTAWLGHVFDVLGGFAAALGALTLWTARYPVPPVMKLGAALAGLAACAWMSATNFQLQSDFRWVLAAALVPWLLAVAALVLDRSPRG